MAVGYYPDATDAQINITTLATIAIAGTRPAAPEPDWETILAAIDDGCTDPMGAEPVTPHAVVQRNHPCPCGSGLKFKKCCRLSSDVK